MLSKRAERALLPLGSYFPAFAKAMERPWSRTDPKGCIVLAVAENRMMSEVFAERLRRCQPAKAEHLYYSDFRGMPELRSSLAQFMTRHITNGELVSEDNIALGNGCGAVLDNLFHLLCDAGDGILLPAPFYPTFRNDIEQKAAGVVVPVATTASNGFFPTVAELECAAASSTATPKALILTNPSNPVGTICDPDLFRAAMEWAISSGIHIISDEIYACSVFGNKQLHLSTHCAAD